MRGFNRVIIAGNLTRDPEIRATINKKTYARFGVAINSKWRNQNGEMQERTEYINVVVWSPLADNCGRYLKKGSPVLVEGRLQTTTYEAKDGSGKRSSTDVVAENVQFLSGGQQPYTPPQPQQPYYQAQPVQSAQPVQPVYNQPPAFEPPIDTDFGKPIGDDGFGPFDPNFGGSETDVPF